MCSSLVPPVCAIECCSGLSASNIRSPALNSRRISGGKDRFNSHCSVPTRGIRKKKKKKRVMFEDDRRPYVVELDEETDLDMLAVLSDRTTPTHMEVVNTQVVPGSTMDASEHGQDMPSSALADESLGPFVIKEIKVMRRVKLDARTAARGGINPLLNQIFQDAYARLCFPLRTKSPCEVVGLTHRITVLDDSTIEIFFIAMSHYREAPPQDLPHLSARPQRTESPSALSLSSSMNQLSLALSSTAAARPALQPLIPFEAFAFQKLQLHKASGASTTATSNGNTRTSMSPTRTTSQGIDYCTTTDTTDNVSQVDPIKTITVANQAVANVTLTSLSYIPGRRIVRYLGPLQLHFIKESWGMTGKSALGTFFYIFQSEIDAAARAQVRSPGMWLCPASIRVRVD